MHLKASPADPSVMSSHAFGLDRLPRGATRFLLPLVVGVLVFGAVTAFAATLNVSSKSLGSGNGTVTSCNASAQVTYNTSYASTIPGYKVTTAPITTAATCSGLSYKVTLTGASSAALGEVTGLLDASGNASPDFSTSNIAASG